MRTNTERYESTHNRAPRGQGNWWFRMGTGEQTTEANYNGTYTEARAQAEETAQAMNYTFVEVMA